MAPVLGAVRSAAFVFPSSLTSLSHITGRTRWPSSSCSIPYSRLNSRSLCLPACSIPYSRLNSRSLCLPACRSNSGTVDTEVETPVEQSEIIFLGTGTSEGIPRVSCLTNPLKKCVVCAKAAEPANKNRRLNTSILIRYAKSSEKCNILVDAGKFFYHSALRWFPSFGLRTIDAVVITHSHADAIGGLCLFVLSNVLTIFVIGRIMFSPPSQFMWHNVILRSCPDQFIMVMKKTHYYLVDTSVIIPGAAVSSLQFNIIDEKPFVVQGLKITPLPVWHGRGYRSLGFRFGNVCYISDVSEIPKETYPLLENCDLLIMDALRPDRSSSTHFGLPKALEEVKKIRPRRTLLTGMMHLMDHEKVNEDLAKLMESDGVDIQLSYDGLSVPVNL